jgi:homoserine O-acetyltransferase
VIGKLKSVRATIDQSAILYMPSETDLYFPIGDARYEAAMMSTVTLTPLPSLWEHTAGAARIRRT